MASLATTDPSVKPMNTEQLKRDVAIHRMASALAMAAVARTNAILEAHQLEPIACTEADRSWARDTVRQLLMLFDVQMTGRSAEAEAEAAARAAAEQARVERARQQALDAELHRQRQRARLLATQRGHALATFGPDPLTPHDEIALCHACRRVVQLVVAGDDVSIAGSAIAEGCLAPTTEAR